MKRRLKYGMRLGDKTVPAGTQVEILALDDPRVQKIFPGMIVLPNISVLVAVFPNDVSFLSKEQVNLFTEII